MRLVPVQRLAALVSSAVLLAVASLTGCTSDDDDPDASTTAVEGEEQDEAAEEEPRVPAGLRVGVVLPDDGMADEAVLDQMAADVRRLDATRARTVAEVRPYRPGDAVFVADLAWTLADRGTDLICVLGRGTRALATELAQLYPDRNVCVAPLSINAEVPEAVQALEIRSEELGHVVGVAAASIAEHDEVIGVVLGTEATPRGSFRDGLIAATEGREVVQTTVDEELDAMAAVEQVLAEGADVVVLDSVAGASDAVELAADQALVLTPEAIVDGVANERSVVTWQVHWDAILRHALERLIDEEAGSAPASFGFAEGTFTVTPGEAASPKARRAIEQVIASFDALERDPLEPSDDVVPPPRPPSDAEDADGDTSDGEDTDSQVSDGEDADGEGATDG